MSNSFDYPFEMRPLSEEEGGGWLISFPDLPGCASDGETPEEAIANVRWQLDTLQCSYTTAMDGLKFTWNETKAAATNFEKRGVSFEETRVCIGRRIRSTDR
jgi:hypothetical protein